METIRTKITRWCFNFFPALWASGGRLTYIADDFSAVELKIRRCMRTRNYVGTMYGGSMYSAVDGIYMVMLIKRLGKEYVVWDKEGCIKYKKPGETSLYASFKIDDTEIEAIKAKLETDKKYVKTYSIDLLNENGEICAEVQKTISMRKKRVVTGAAD